MENKFIQITAGRGPSECSWVAAKVLQAFLDEGRAKGYTCTVHVRETGSINGTVLSAIVEVEGKAITDWLDSWNGTVQWVGKSTFRKFHKRKNWFIGVQRIPLDKALVVNPSEIRYEAVRSGGPGGQHVNKVSTAVRATHEPSRLTLLVSDNRSQLQNRKNAEKRMLNLLRAKATAKQLEQTQANWQNHNVVQRGNPVRVFTGSDFKSKPIKKTHKEKRKNEKLQAKRQVEAALGDD